jgi:hypothetical protein
VLLASTALASLPAKADTFVTLGGVDWNITNTQILSLTAVVPGGNQPLNVQCIICGENQPQQSPTFGYTDFHNAGNQSSEIYFSTQVPGGANPGTNTIGIGYDGSFLRNYLLATGATTFSFTVGIDANDTNAAQTLTSFYMLNLTQHLVLAAFQDGAAGNIASAHNGTGFPDYTLGNFTLALGTPQFVAGDQIVFFARIDGANDGPDSFFLQPTAVAVPGPIVGAGIPGLLAACFGMFGLRTWRRRRNGGNLPA